MEALYLLVGFTLGMIASVVPTYIERKIYVAHLAKLGDEELSEQELEEHWSQRPIPQEPEDMSAVEKQAEQYASYFGN